MKSKRIFSVVIALFVGGQSFAKLNVVTTTPDLASIASYVGGKNVSVKSIVTGARDPHRIEAKPSYMSQISRADLFIAIGLDLEIGYERVLLDGSRNSHVRIGALGHLYASEGALVLDRPTGTVTRAQGDIHPYGNPHIWLDPYNGRVVAQRIAERMSALDTSNAGDYKKGARNFIDKLDRKMFGDALVEKYGGEELWQWERNGELFEQLRKVGSMNLLGGWVKASQVFRGKTIITYHRSFVYFINRFDLRSIGELEPKPGIEPTPGHLASLMRRAQEENVRVIIQEPFYSTRHANFVASRIGAKVVILPGNIGHDSSAKDYFSLFDTIISRLREAFS
ncbi:MAG TPA: metal ABC transporter substrate-binding protein [Fimbriimonadales bacterium]|nr:metal ABC transporter substrate-binding protein [Fimbriimonadales bacterium]